MPQPGLQLFLLLSAVPLQYLISQWMTPNVADREYFTRRLLQNSGSILSDIFNISEWKNILLKTKDKLLNWDNSGECPAREVMRFNEPNGYFSGSPEVRTDRKNVKYRVGQVIRHLTYGYRGVIIGWDYTAKAPASWLQANHFDNKWRDEPNYSVLVDTRDRTDKQTTYVVEQNMAVISNEKVNHPDVDEYFDYFDGSQYIPRPWLKELYPNG